LSAIAVDQAMEDLENLAGSGLVAGSIALRTPY